MTNKKRACTSQLRELAASYALNALDIEDRLDFEAHLREGCPACAQELQSFEVVTGDLGTSVPADPPPDLKARLLAKIHTAPQVPGLLLEQDGLLVSRSDEIPWRTLAPGIQVKMLYHDPVRKYHTSLVRMDAGAHYPSHRHREIEELFILSGELRVEGQTVHAGDYCRADSGTIHGETFTDAGAMFLLMASQLDEMVA